MFALYSGVLVAISIPIFTSQLEKSREATDLANLRSAYAEVMTAGLTEDTSNYTQSVGYSGALKAPVRCFGNHLSG